MSWITKIIVLFFLTIAPLSSGAAQVIVKGRVPAQAKYHNFQRWYVNHSVVDVIADGNDPKALIELLEEVDRLRGKRVLLRRLFVIGSTNAAMLSPSSRQRVLANAHGYKNTSVPAAATINPISRSLAAAAAQAGVGDASAAPGLVSALAKLQVQTLPAWIVTYRGKLYIYEGADSVAGYFSADGRFRDGQD